MSSGVKASFLTPLTANDSSAKDSPGDIRWDGNKCYKYVKFNSGTGAVAAAANKGTVYHGDNGYDDHEVTTDYSDGDGIFAGTLQGVITTGNYCWIQIKGPVTLAAALTAGADGNALTAIGAGDGTLDVSAAVTDHVAAIAIDASEKKVLLDCLF